MEPQSGGMAVRVRASFDCGIFVTDEAEFVLSSSSSTAAFRVASSAGGVWPFSSDAGVLKRNRERMLKVRARLFKKNSWHCACPPDLNPFAGHECALTCDL